MSSTIPYMLFHAYCISYLGCVVIQMSDVFIVFTRCIGMIQGVPLLLFSLSVITYTLTIILIYSTFPMDSLSGLALFLTMHV